MHMLGAVFLSAKETQVGVRLSKVFGAVLTSSDAIIMVDSRMRYMAANGRRFP